MLWIQVQALEKFLNYTETLNDVYYVTATQVIPGVPEGLYLGIL